MAAAVTSGVVARMIDAAGLKKLKPNLVKAMLQYSATTLRDAQQVPYDRMTQGAGEINSNGAVTLVKATNLSAPLNQYLANLAGRSVHDLRRARRALGAERHLG